MKQTIEELKRLQSQPLETKVTMTRQRVREWVTHWGEEGVYVAFSGGKDSTVLLDIVRRDYPNVTAVFVDTGLEYPEIREFVKGYDNVVWLKPKMNFRQVIDRFGYPFISKEVSDCIHGAKKCLRSIQNNYGNNESKLIEIAADIVDNKKYYEKAKVNVDEEKEGFFRLNARTAMLMGIYGLAWGKKIESANKKDNSLYSYKKYQFLLDAPFDISSMCCNVMKKNPAHEYSHNTGKHQMTAQMAAESRLRLQKWLENGCNGFGLKEPISNPMSFWTEEDVLQYISQNKLPIASVYGDIVSECKNEIEGQLSLEDYGLIEKSKCLKTTGCNRTGCVFCLYGIHLEKSPNRLERLKVTHPKLYDYVMRPEEQGGLGYKEKIDWINEHGNMNIKY